VDATSPRKEKINDRETGLAINGAEKHRATIVTESRGEEARVSKRSDGASREEKTQVLHKKELARVRPEVIRGEAPVGGVGRGVEGNGSGL